VVAQDNLNPVYLAAVNAIQQLTVDATGGNFTLGFKNSTTESLPYNVPGVGQAVLTTIQDGVSPSTPEKQKLAIQAYGGTFTFTVSGFGTTGALAYNVSAANLQSAIVGIAAGLTGKVTVLQNADGTYSVTFDASLGNLTTSVDSSSLKGLQSALEVLADIG